MFFLFIFHLAVVMFTPDKKTAKKKEKQITKAAEKKVKEWEEMQKREALRLAKEEKEKEEKAAKDAKKAQKEHKKKEKQKAKKRVKGFEDDEWYSLCSLVFVSVSRPALSSFLSFPIFLPISIVFAR